MEVDREAILKGRVEALQARLTVADEHNDQLIAALNKVRSTVCLPASIEAILISALERKEKN